MLLIKNRNGTSVNSGLNHINIKTLKNN